MTEKRKVDKHFSGDLFYNIAHTHAFYLFLWKWQ